MSSLEPFVDGCSHPSASLNRHDVVNPSTGKSLHSIAEGAPADVDLAVNSARAAFEDNRWNRLPVSRRKEVLHRLADLVAGQASQLDALDGLEMGKPISLSFGSASTAAVLTRFYAESVDKVTGDVYASDSTSFVAQRRVARGVVAAVVPWNFPTYVTLLKVAPALAAGNSVVLKPSELSPSSALRIAELALDAGLPPGVFNVIPGVGQTVGQALARHMDVDMITFTGSTAVGGKMLEYAGRSNLKTVMVECGGKSPQILFDDGVDLDGACAAIARFLLTNQGQICNVGSRLLVQRSIEAEVVERTAEHMRQIRLGDALDPETTFGPVASVSQRDRVLQFIKTATAEGAEVALGGGAPDSAGYFIEPTVVRRVDPRSRLAQMEVFGPVMAVIPFDNEAEAIRIANGTIYGLKAYAWTADLSRAMRLVKAIRSSIVVNAAPPGGEGAGFAASSEPAGQSGIGVEGGLAGLESYLRRQQVWINSQLNRGDDCDEESR